LLRVPCILYLISIPSGYHTMTLYFYDWLWLYQDVWFVIQNNHLDFNDSDSVTCTDFQNGRSSVTCLLLKYIFEFWHEEEKRAGAQAPLPHVHVPAEWLLRPITKQHEQFNWTFQTGRITRGLIAIPRKLFHLWLCSLYRNGFLWSNNQLKEKLNNFETRIVYRVFKLDYTRKLTEIYDPVWYW